MKTRTLLTALILLIGLQFANAQKIIYGGPVEGLWEYNNSPYIIRGSIYINDHKTLQIEAGVNVIFETTDPFIVNGSIIAIGNSSDTILFSTNIPERGWGGIRFEDILAGNEMSHLSYCKFEYASASGEWPYHSGGAIGIKYTNNVTVDHSLFEYNRALNHRKNGSKNGSSGGAIAIWLSEVRLTKNVFRYNESINGGAIFIDKYSKAVIDNSLFYGNTAMNNGGAVSVSDHAVPSFINCTFADNYANGKGGAVTVSEMASPTFVNSILWGNAALDEGNQINVTKQAGFNLYYSNIEGGLNNIAGYSVDDNTNIFYEYDPRYLATGVFPYSLDEYSPVVDRGTLNSLFMPQDYDHPATDLHYNRRISGMTIDIGYFENEIYPKDHPVHVDNTPKSAEVYSDWAIVEHTGTQSDFIAVQFTDDYHGWVISEDGTMIYTKDGGLSWKEEYFGPSIHLKDLHFVDNDNGFVVGNIEHGPLTKGVIYQTNDGGKTWEINYLSQTNSTINKLAFSTVQDGFATGNTLSPSGNEGLTLITTDGGETWEDYAIRTPGILITGIQFSSENEGWAIGTMDVGPSEVDIILKSENGGRGWDITYFGTVELGLNGINFFETMTGIVVGEQGSVLSTVDAGNNWNAINIDGYEFNGALSGADSKAWIVGDNGAILSTYNSGSNWVQEYTLLNKDLNAICSTPNGYLWVVGDEGTLYLQKPVKIYGDQAKQDMDNSSTKGAAIPDDGINHNSVKDDGPLVRHKNYPNPFAGKTTIAFEIDSRTHIKIDIYNINGKLVTTLLDQHLEIGNHEVMFDADKLSPGIYTYILRTGNHVENGKMMITM